MLVLWATSAKCWDEQCFLDGLVALICSVFTNFPHSLIDLFSVGHFSCGNTWKLWLEYYWDGQQIQIEDVATILMVLGAIYDYLIHYRSGNTCAYYLSYRPPNYADFCV